MSKEYETIYCDCDCKGCNIFHAFDFKELIENLTDMNYHSEVRFILDLAEKEGVNLNE